MDLEEEADSVEAEVDSVGEVEEDSVAQAEEDLAEEAEVDSLEEAEVDSAETEVEEVDSEVDDSFLKERFVFYYINNINYSLY